MAQLAGGHGKSRSYTAASRVKKQQKMTSIGGRGATAPLPYGRDGARPSPAAFSGSPCWPSR